MKPSHARLYWAIAGPLLALQAGILTSAFLDWLEQSLGGTVAMCCLIAAALGWIGHMVWTWPGWSEEEEE